MSNNQYPTGGTQNYAGSMPSSGNQQHPEGQRQHEGMGGGQSNQQNPMMPGEQEKSFGMGQQNTATSYNNNYMGQNQPGSQPSFGQNPMQSSQGSFGQEHRPLGGEGMGSQSQSMPSQMMGQSTPSQNQPPIGQRNYQPYPQSNYGGSQPMGQNNGQNLGGMNSNPMGSSYMGGNPTSQNTGMPSMGMGSGTGTFPTSQGEKTYEPGIPGQITSTIGGVGISFADLPVSPEVAREFEEKASK